MPAIHAFHKSRRLRKTDEISSVFSFKRQVNSEHLRILAKPNDRNQSRFVAIVRKKTVPLAVERNYTKRSLRELFRLNQGLLNSLDLVALVQKKFDRSEFHLIEMEFLQLIGELQAKLAKI